MPNSIDVFKSALARELESQGVSKLELHRRTKLARTSLDGYLDGADPGFRALDKISAALGKQPWELLKPEGAEPTHAPDALGLFRELLPALAALDYDGLEAILELALSLSPVRSSARDLK